MRLRPMALPWFAVVVFLTFGRTVAAQIQAPQLAVGAGGGVAFPVHSDFDFAAGTWQVNIRGALGSHAAVEVFFDEWRHSSGRDLPAGRIVGSSGVVTGYGRLTERTRHRTRAVGFNALATGSTGRVVLAGGGGIGYFGYRRVFEQELVACEPPAPEICQPFSTTHTSSSFSVQGVGSVDVAITSRNPAVMAFGQIQFIAPVDDFGFGHLGVVGGIRVGFRR